MLGRARRRGLRLMLGASQAVLLGAAGVPKAEYAHTVTTIPGLLAYWRFSNTSGVINSAAGQRHGTYDGPVTLVPGLPTASDAGSHLAGNVAGVVPHDPGLQLPAFTLSAWVQLVEVPTDPNWFFLTKDASGLVDGDFGVRFTPQLELNARFQTIQDGTAPGVSVTVEVGRTYHVLVTAGPHGMSMWIDGTLIDTDPTYAGGWIANTQPIWFARGIANNFLANVVLDEIALYSRVLADAEIIALSQQTNLPVATDDHGFEVSSGATEIFNVVANDSWVGRRESLAIDIISPPAFGAVSVRSNNTIELAGYPVEQDEADSFTYRIRDAVGQSNVATVSFTVLNEALPPPLGDLTTREPLCYVESAADTVVVSSAAALETAVNNAPAGRNILIAAGTYAGGTRTFSPGGAVGNPVVVRPQNGIGSVTINDATWTVNGNGLVISKLHFNRSQVRIQGNRNRLTRCRFRQINKEVVQVNTGLDTRFDHLDIADLATSTNVFVYNRIGIRDGTIKRSLMDHIHFHNLIDGQANDKRLIDMARGTELNQVPDIELVKSLVDDIDLSGEYIVVKHSRMRIAYCTFADTRGYLQQRQGSGWEIRSCWFEGTMSSGPLKCWDGGQECDPAWRPPLIIGNRLVNHDLWIGAGSADTCGTGGGIYHASKDGRYIGNVIDGGTIRVGEMWSGQPNAVPAQSNVLEANIRNGAPATTSNGIVLVHHASTAMQTTTAELFTPAVKLTSADVGVAAPDPFCSSGPQS